jgi:Skp family chaperone for outer membrane proteins
MLKNLFTGFFKTQPIVAAVVTIEQKAEELVLDLKNHVLKFEEEAEDALDMFKATVKKLQKIEDKITTKRTMIQDYVSKLTELDMDLGQKQENNAKVKSKFEDFLN